MDVGEHGHAVTVPVRILMQGTSTIRFHNRGIDLVNTFDWREAQPAVFNVQRKLPV